MVPHVVRLRVPATSANLGPGFDALGLALDLHDEIEATLLASPGGLEVVVTGEGTGEVALDDTHLVLQAMSAGAAALGAALPSVRVHCRNAIPHGRGLGSSSAAIVAGLLLAEALLPERAYAPGQALALATALEGHPDNVAPCLLGGFTIAWRDARATHAVRLAPHPDLVALVFVPAEPVRTHYARGLLPPRVPHADAAFAAGRAALLVEALTRRPDLLLPATEDTLHQGYRAPAMPASAALLDRLRRRGVPAVISGAGPSVLALVGREEAGAVLAGEAAGVGEDTGFRALRMDLAAEGAVVVGEAEASRRAGGTDTPRFGRPGSVGGGVGL